MSRRIRTLSVMAAGAMLAGALGQLPASAATSARAKSAAQTAAVNTSAEETAFSGSAYGTEVSLARVVQSGRSALVTLGCTAQTGVVNTNTVASLTTPVLSTGTVDTSTASETTPTGVASSSSASTQGVSALGGAVTATAVESDSTTSVDSKTGALSTSAAGTEFVGLTVGGTPIGGTPAPNTRITLPGIGYVVLNQQTSTVGRRTADLAVTGIHIFVTASTPVAPVGTQIRVSYAFSALGSPVSGLLDGLAYGASAHLGTTVIAGREFPQPLACVGTDGAVRTNKAAAVSLAGVLSTGTVVDSVQGNTATPTPTARVSSTVQGVNLLAGEVTAKAIKADVKATGEPPTFADDSTFVGLRVAGYPGIKDNVPPNTKLSIPGVGTLWLHRVIQTGNKITVVMVQLVVTAASNPFGLGVGTRVNVASATVSIR
jgi:hypothetical protein